MTDKLNPNRQPELSEHDAELLSAYIDEMLPADERRVLEARLANEVFLRAELAAMRQTVAWMNALPTLKAPRNFTISATDIAPVKKAPERKVIPMQNRNWWFAASAAAVIVVLIGIVAIVPTISNTSYQAVNDNTGGEVAFLPTPTALPSEAVLQTFASTVEDTSEDANDGIALSVPVPEAEAGDEDGEIVSDMADSAANSTGMDESAEIMANTGASAANASQAEAQAPVDTASRNAVANVQLTATALTQLYATTPTQAFAATESMTFAQGGGASPQNTSLPPAVAQSALESTEELMVDTVTMTDSEAPEPGSVEEAIEEMEAENVDTFAFSASDIPEEADDASVIGLVDEDAQEKEANIITATLNAVRAFIQGLQ